MVRAALASLMAGLGLAAFAGEPPGAFSIEWETNRSRVRLSGPVSGDLLRLEPVRMDTVFPVTVEPPDVLRAIGLPPVSGTYTARPGVIEFEPRYPFEPGVAYRASFHPAKISSVLRLPRPALAPSAVVSEIYPTSASLPQNLLKFYLHFSAPMSGGHIYENIALANEAGEPVELPFLEIDEELWNPEMTRLTLFLDPGRIKREVRPLEEIGPALLPERTYTLTVRDSWRDARGAPLLASFQKTFSVTAPDRSPPDPKAWTIAPPKAGTRAPLVVTFDGPLDHALALRMISILGVIGKSTLRRGEQELSFEPDLPWTPGRHELRILSTIEDLAGNNIGKPFEVDLAEGSRPRAAPLVISRFFEISP